MGASKGLLTPRRSCDGALGSAWLAKLRVARTASMQWVLRWMCDRRSSDCEHSARDAATSEYLIVAAACLFLPRVITGCHIDETC